MKKLIIIVSGLVVGASIFTSCYRDILSPGADPNAPPQLVTFSGDIQPIFNKSCNNSGCHDGVPTKKPSLTASNSYNALMNGGYVNLLVPASSGIYLSVKDNSMPVGGTLSAAEKQKILDWIRLGAPNN